MGSIQISEETGFEARGEKLLLSHGDALDGVELLRIGKAIERDEVVTKGLEAVRCCRIRAVVRFSKRFRRI